eukprot:EG_transcript_21828
MERLTKTTSQYSSEKHAFMALCASAEPLSSACLTSSVAREAKRSSWGTRCMNSCAKQHIAWQQPACAAFWYHLMAHHRGPWPLLYPSPFAEIAEIVPKGSTNIWGPPHNSAF